MTWLKSTEGAIVGSIIAERVEVCASGERRVAPEGGAAALEVMISSLLDAGAGETSNTWPLLQQLSELSSESAHDTLGVAPMAVGLCSVALPGWDWGCKFLSGSPRCSSHPLTRMSAASAAMARSPPLSSPTSTPSTALVACANTVSEFDSS